MDRPDRAICIHGHFYQPPRENPWLETVEAQDSAAPYHDWNDRITAECYAPNAAARIVDQQNLIIRILNNYSRMSFNFGPTLLSWLQENARRVHDGIVQADHRSQNRFSGHGSAMAQIYNHLIMPLANTRDKITQIRWGIADFRHRFGRLPEGMWLPETAVDLETLDLLAQHRIRFVVLAPHQSARIRPLARPAKVGEAAPWIETAHADVDTRRPYLVRLREKRTIAVFFYDGPRSRAIAFEGLLNSGEAFAQRLMGGFTPDSKEPQIVHVATDGESYGHHHHFGEMALAWMLRWVQEQKHSGENLRLTNYGEFLEQYPPQFEAEIVEDTSWSCAHGIERWRSNCGCSGGKPGWNQKWREPLREALDWLRDSVAPLVREEGGRIFNDVDAARNGYIGIILDRSRESRDAFLQMHAKRQLNQQERTRAFMLMELERHAQLMYTSCGWFFDDISGIETVQVIAYAGRVVQLAGELFGERTAGIEGEFVRKLAAAKSNVPEQQDGASVYNRLICPLRVGLEQVAAHYAISSMFTTYPDEAELFCYTVRRIAYETALSGRVRMVVGQALVTSRITEAAEPVEFAVLHFGDQNITASVKPWNPAAAEAHRKLVAEAKSAVTRADFPAVVRAFDRHFGGEAYSIRSLFHDEQRRILEILLQSTVAEVETSLSAIYENQAALLHFLSQAGLPRPEPLNLAATFAINAGLRKVIETDPIDPVQLRIWLGLAEADQIAIDSKVLSYLVDQKMKGAMVALAAEPTDEQRLDTAVQLARTVRELPFGLNLWQAQNLWYDAFRMIRELSLAEASLDKWKELGRQMHISVEKIVEEDVNGNGTKEANGVVEAADKAGYAGETAASSSSAASPGR